jgi:hypothetical protein
MLVSFLTVAATLLASLSLSAAPAVAAPQTVSGTVSFGTDGNHPAGVTAVITWQKYVTDVYVAGPAEGVRTDAEGRYSLSLEPGSYKLRFAPTTPGYQTLWWGGVGSEDTTTVVEVSDASLGEMDITLPQAEVAAEEPSPMVEAAAQGTASISGTIRTEAGAPIAGAKVTATAWDPTDWSTEVVGEAFTTADGTYVLTGLPAAGYELDVTADGYVNPWIPFFELAEGEQRTGVDAAMKRYRSISGSITCDRCDEPEVGENLYVLFDRNVGTRAEPAWVYAGGVLATPTEAADGAAAYTFSTADGLEPGSYRATVGGHWGWRTRANFSPAVTVADDAKVTLDLTADFLKFDRDFSGDEHPDVLVRTSTGAMLMYTGDGASGWKGASTIGSGWTVMNHVFAAGDFSGDGHEDVMARDSAGRLHLYRGDGKGGWLGWGVVGTGWGQMTAIFSPGDFSGDGNADVLARDAAGDLWLYPGDGKGGWGAVSKVGSGWNIFDTVFAAGDFGGYGEANVMGRMPNGDLWVYQASGWGDWMGQYRAGIGWNMFDAVFGAGDFDGDGWDDVMGRDRSGNLHLYPGNGGLFKLPSVVGTGWGHLSFVS